MKIRSVMRLFGSFIFLSLAACANSIETGPEIGSPYLGAESCDADALGYLLGQSIREVDVDTLPQPRRIIPPGTAVTMDYREERTNFELDGNDRVVRVYCG